MKFYTAPKLLQCAFKVLTVENTNQVSHLAEVPHNGESWSERVVDFLTRS